LNCLGHCVFVDAEHALNPALAEAIGVKTENLLLSQPDCGKQALSLVDTLIRSGSVDVVVVDSVSNVVPMGLNVSALEFLVMTVFSLFPSSTGYFEDLFFVSIGFCWMHLR